MRRLLIGLVIILIALLGVFVVMQSDDVKDQAASKGDAGVLVGGPFTLINHEGEAVSDQTYKGKLLLIYFGFTFCPDVCPTELQKMSIALDQLSDKERAQIAPLFITVDPERDTVEQMAQYVGNFHPDIIGLTGSADQVKAAASAYRIYMQKVVDDSSSADYTMDHSNLIYLMDGENHYIAHFTARSTADDIARALRRAF